jgi:hypothetical protein
MRSTCHQAGADGRPLGRAREADAVGQASAVQHLAVYVELALVSGGVAQAHRFGTIPAWQGINLAFLDLPSAIDAVHDPHLVRRPGNSAEQPLKPSLRFGVEAGVEQSR